MADAGDTIETSRIILKDSKGRARIELSAKSVLIEPPGADEDDESFVTHGPEIVFFTTDGKRRLSIGVYDSDETENESYMAGLNFYGKDERTILELTTFWRDGYLHLRDKRGKTCLRLGFRQYDDEARPEIILSGKGGWRMMLTVTEDQPHLVCYDGENDPRLQLTVDRSGNPHVRRHWWKALIPRLKWNGYYPSNGAGG